jgi:CPA1 family monovalent cation:H+ antiporter
MNSEDKKACSHVDQIQEGIEPKTPDGCEECLKLGDDWVELRKCLVCGHVGCCDSSAGKHATKHFEETGHPVVEAYKSDKSWRWCYVDEMYAE